MHLFDNELLIALDTTTNSREKGGEGADYVMDYIDQFDDIIDSVLCLLHPQTVRGAWYHYSYSLLWKIKAGFPLWSVPR